MTVKLVHWSGKEITATDRKTKFGTEYTNISTLSLWLGVLKKDEILAIQEILKNIVNAIDKVVPSGYRSIINIDCKASLHPPEVLKIEEITDELVYSDTRKGPVVLKTRFSVRITPSSIYIWEAPQDHWTFEVKYE